MKLNVTQDLRNKLLKMPEVDIFDTKLADAEPIDIIGLTMSDTKKVKLKASNAKEKFLSEHSGDDDMSQYFSDVEYNDTLKYWSVVYSLAVDEQPAHKLNGLDQVTNYIDNFFGTKFSQVFEDLAIDACERNGLDLIDTDLDEQEEETATGYVTP